MTKQAVLFELGCEELPSGAVYPLGEALAEQTTRLCQERGIAFETIRFFATPRRLAVYLTAVPDQLPSQTIHKRGPAKAAGMDATGQPTPALIGFAKSCGVSIDALTIQSTDKGAWYGYEKTEPGQSITHVLPILFQAALAGLPILKPMYWGAQQGPFVRPVHWIVLMYGTKKIAADFFGIQSDAYTYGHRYHFPQPQAIASPSHYESTLTSLKVIPDFKERRKKISQLIHAIADAKQAKVVTNEALMDEITSIVEWPVALCCHFSETFLRLPQEVLIASMHTHQKCVALRNQDNQLLPHFITLANIDSLNPAQVIAGNEKVMAARLSDADFFYTQDRKQPLSSFFPQLEHTLLQAKLGSLADQVRRVEQIILTWIPLLRLDSEQVKQAVSLSKCDLMTGMVGEFPDLQGVIGSYYAQADHLPKAVSLAIEEQYLPRFSQDTLPTTPLGMALSLANRLDLLVGIFGIGQKPTGVKDPYKLRRHALAVVRLLANCDAPLNLSACLAATASTFPAGCLTKLSLEELKTFILERLPAYYAAQDINASWVASVCAVQSEHLYDQAKRIIALQQKQAHLTPLLGGIKRVSQLLKSVDKSCLHTAVDRQCFVTEEERALDQALQQTKEALAALYESGDYAGMLDELGLLRPVIDQFFDSVMIMVEDKSVRENRLRLLYDLQQVLLSVADLSLFVL